MFTIHVKVEHVVFTITTAQTVSLKSTSSFKSVVAMAMTLQKPGLA